MGQRGEIASHRIFTEDGKKTYFFNIKENRNRDLFLNLVVSRKSDDGFKRASIIIFQEDILDFTDMLDDAISEIRQNDQFLRTLVSSSEKREYIFQHSKHGRPALQIQEERKDSVGKGYRETIFISLETLDDFFNGYKRILVELKRLRKLKESRS